MTKEYQTPEVTEYGPVSTVTEGSGTNKVGSGSDEFSSGTSLTGSVGTGSNIGP
ncbi:lasso RiPP family leader peptide-containing protein [Halobellus ruber]|uniref:Lasso RiPP family leader peptide-containing protein n=1 Tax=Halobellus ruber TaxID=2761102 RepID=A0A7J9SKH7_9EURY|nr:lasso RiPP family leader peptide-containing protein [Halobellus ruber]